MILDDLINNKLAQGMITLNLRGDNYLTDVGSKVIHLMGFRGMQNEIVFMHYLTLTTIIKDIMLKLAAIIWRFSSRHNLEVFDLYKII